MSNLISVTVQFEDSQYNYSTSVNGKVPDEEIRQYFVGTKFNVGVFPTENLQRCVSVIINRKNREKKYHSKAKEADTRTTPLYWDCECESNYIHPKSETACKICGVDADDMPDSRINEVQSYITDKQVIIF